MSHKKKQFISKHNLYLENFYIMFPLHKNQHYWLTVMCLRMIKIKKNT